MEDCCLTWGMGDIHARYCRNNPDGPGGRVPPPMSEWTPRAIIRSRAGPPAPGSRGNPSSAKPGGRLWSILSAKGGNANAGTGKGSVKGEESGKTNLKEGGDGEVPERSTGAEGGKVGGEEVVAAHGDPQDSGIDELSSDDELAVDWDESDGDTDEDVDFLPKVDPPSEAITGTTPGDAIPHLLRLPMELHLEIFTHIVANELAEGETPLDPVDIARLFRPEEISPRAHRQICSYNFMLTDPTIRNEVLHDIGKTHPIVFYSLPDLEDWVKEKSMQQAHSVILDLGKVPEKKMKRALYILRNLSNLHVLEVRCTPCTRDVIRLPLGWKGFEHLERVQIVDVKLRDEQWRAQEENEQAYTAARERITTLKTELEAFDKDNARVKRKLAHIPPIPSTADGIGEILLKGRWAIMDEIAAALDECQALRAGFQLPECGDRALRLEFQNKRLAHDVLCRRWIKEGTRFMELRWCPVRKGLFYFSPES